MDRGRPFIERNLHVFVYKYNGGIRWDTSIIFITILLKLLTVVAIHRAVCAYAHER